MQIDKAVLHFHGCSTPDGEGLRNSKTAEGSVSARPHRGRYKLHKTPFAKQKRKQQRRKLLGRVRRLLDGSRLQNATRDTEAAREKFFQHFERRGGGDPQKEAKIFPIELPLRPPHQVVQQAGRRRARLAQRLQADLALLGAAQL